MIQTICDSLAHKITTSVNGYDESRIEEISFGLQLLIGEIPKFFITFILAWLLNIIDLTIISFMIILPYRMFSGGFHLNTHLGCIIATNTMYIGSAYLAKILYFSDSVKFIMIAITFIFSFAMISKYAPADTENVPVLQRKERKKRKMWSFIIAGTELAIAITTPYRVISNMINIGILIQTLTITKLAYRVTKNKYGYEVYG